MQCYQPNNNILANMQQQKIAKHVHHKTFNQNDSSYYIYYHMS